MWLDSSGREMTDTGWTAPDVRSLGVLLAGDAIDEVDERGRRVSGDTLLVLYNAAPAPVTFVLPADGARGKAGNNPAWKSLLETEDPDRPSRSFAAGDRFPLAGHAIAVFRRLQ